MPRDHARLLVSIWADDDWKALSAAAQWMYMLLTSQPNITVAGTLSMTVTRWSGFAYGMTPHAARTAVSLGGKFTEDNLVAACSPCNRSKGATPVEARR